MTYKHIKFSESEVMRSLEKVAFDKGLIQNKHKKMVDLIVKKSQFTSDYSEEEPQFTPGPSEDPFNLGFRPTAEEAYKRSLRQEEANKSAPVYEASGEDNSSRQSLPYGYTQKPEEALSTDPNRIMREFIALNERQKSREEKEQREQQDQENKQFYADIKAKVNNYLYGTPVDPKAVIWNYNPSLKYQLEQSINSNLGYIDTALQLLAYSPEPITATIGGVYTALKRLDEGDYKMAALEILFTIPGLRVIGGLAKATKAGLKGYGIAKSLRAVPKESAKLALESIKQSAAGILKLKGTSTMKEMAWDLGGTLALAKVQSWLQERQRKGEATSKENNDRMYAECRARYAKQLSSGVSQALDEMSLDCRSFAERYEKDFKDGKDTNAAPPSLLPGADTFPVISSPGLAERLRSK